MAGLLLNRSRQVPAEETPAFAGIAERFRRAGDLDRAITLCRDGLKRFPTQLSARVTLGWALLDRGEYEEARAELEQVIRRAPDNLAAIRGLAELHDRADNAPASMDAASQWQMPVAAEPEPLPEPPAAASFAAPEPPAPPTPVPDWSAPLAVPNLSSSSDEQPAIINVPHESLSFSSSEPVAEGAPEHADEAIELHFAAEAFSSEAFEIEGDREQATGDREHGTGIRLQEIGGRQETRVRGQETEDSGQATELFAPHALVDAGTHRAEAFSVSETAARVENHADELQPIDLMVSADASDAIEGLDLAALADAADAEAAKAAPAFVLSPFEAHETTIDLDVEPGDEASEPAPASELPAGVGSLDFGDPFVQPEAAPIAAASTAHVPAALPVSPVESQPLPAVAASTGFSLDLPVARHVPVARHADVPGANDELSPDLGVVSLGPLGDVPIDVAEPIHPMASLGAVDLADEVAPVVDRTAAADDRVDAPREPVPEAASAIHDYELPATTADSDAVWGFGRAAIAAPVAMASEAVPGPAPANRSALRSLESFLRKVEARRLQLQLQSGSPA
jgi:tetratricopeptide (TPR) repeat protein